MRQTFHLGQAGDCVTGRILLDGTGIATLSHHEAVPKIL